MPDILLPHHELTAEATLGPLHLHASLTLSASWTVIFGPSGSGKSSLLLAACGLIPEAKVDFLGFSTDGSHTQLEKLATHRRALGYAPQHAALFPHLSAEDNIRFPSQVCESPSKNSDMIKNVLALFNLGGLADRMPARLSGGERRRVALARAFTVPNCRLMLLDEPFTGLDRKLRNDLLPAMQAWLAVRKIPVLSVTHDVDEALLLGADVIRIEDGRVLAQGPAAEVLATERERLLQTLS